MILDVLLLGPPLVNVDGEPLEVDTRKAIATLAFLALQPGPQSRERLAALLWPESDSERARGALRRTLSTLKRALHGQWIVIRRDTVELAVGDSCRADVRAFRDAIAAGRAGEIAGLERAVALYRDDLMAGFSLRDSLEFEEWLAPRAEEFRSDYVSALARLVDYHCGTGAFADADRHASLWLACDPLNESAHQWRMKAAAWAGDRSAALARYRDCVRTLDAELGVQPLEETTELYLAIRAGTFSPPERASDRQSAVDPSEVRTPPASSGHDTGAFVGRESEIARLMAGLGSDAVTPGVVLVEGEAGVGKTRLVDQYLARTGAEAWRIRCYPGESALAYGPVRELVALALRDTGDLAPGSYSEAARLMGGAGPDASGPLDSTGAQLRFFAGVGDVLARGARGRVVVLDDAQWIDSASADLVGYLLRRPSEYPLSLVIGLRTEDAGEGAESLRDSVVGVDGEIVTLPRLSREEIDAWVQAVLGEVSEGIAVRLERESEGLPLLVNEYLAMLGAGGAGTGDWMIPGRAREVLGARLRSLSDLDRQLVTAASAIGRPFSFDELRDASGRTEDEVVTALDQLLARRVLVENQHSRTAAEWEFTHEKLRELAYESMTVTRRRLVHRRLAEALRKHGTSAETARHLELAGLENEAAVAYFAAGEEARLMFANRDALGLYASALAMGYSDGARVHRAIGDVHSLTGDFEQALTEYETAAALSSGADLQRVEHTLGRIYMRLGDFEQADERFRAALAAPPGLGEEERALVLADCALLASKRDDPARAHSLAGEVIALGRGAGSMAALARGQIVLGIIARGDGASLEALTTLEEGLRLARDAAAPELLASALNALALAAADIGDIARAIELGEQALALCEEQGDRQRAAAIHSNLADFHHARTDAEAAAQHLEASAAVFAEIGVVSGAHRPEVWKLVDW